MNVEHEMNEEASGPLNLQDALMAAGSFREHAHEDIRQVEQAKDDLLRKQEERANARREELDQSLIELRKRLDLEQERLRADHAELSGSAMDTITHFYGSTLLSRADWVGAYTGLESKILDHAGVNEYPVPVLILPEVKAGGYDEKVTLQQEVSFLLVDTSYADPIFKATAKRREQSAHAFTGEKLDVTDARLSLIGSTIQITAPLDAEQIWPRQIETGSSLLLAQSTLQTGKCFAEAFQNDYFAGSYAYQDRVATNFLRPPLLSMFDPEPEDSNSHFPYFVGWEELEKLVLSYSDRERERVIHNLLSCFRHTGQEHFHGVQTPLGNLFQHICDGEKVQEEIKTNISNRIKELGQ